MWSVSDLISAKIVQLASPQPLNYPQSSRHAPRPEGARPGKGGVFHSRRSSGSASPPPAPSEAAHVQRPCSRTAQYHSHLRAQSAYHLSPAIAAGYRSAGLSGGIWGHFPGHHRRDTILFPEPRLHAPNPGQTLACRRVRGNQQRGFTALPQTGAVRDANASSGDCSPGSFPPHSPPRVSPSRSPLGT